MTSNSTTVARVGRWLGPVAAVAMFGLLETFSFDIAPSAQVTAAIATLVSAWWITEAFPVGMVSLLPLLLFPLAGVLKLDQAAASYGSKYVFLFMAGFMISRALERWNLHRRFALMTVVAVGTNPARLIGGVMLATGLVSMWISNTATAAMMLPLGMSLVAIVRERAGQTDDTPAASEASSHFATGMMLGIAYSASIGGMGTLVGTPTNMMFKGFAAARNMPVSFGDWMLFATPMSAVFLVLAWLLLTKLLFPVAACQFAGGRELIRAELQKLGPMSRGEWTVLIVFAMTSMGWVTQGWLAKIDWLVTTLPFVKRLDDTLIGLAGAVALFLIPVDRAKGLFALDWSTAATIPWDILLLFGGGFCLADAISASQLSDWVGSHVMQLAGFPSMVLVFCSVALLVVMSELASNTPTATAFLPILESVARGVGLPPLLLLIPATLAASCGFMLPVATPPNAIAFGSGYIKMPQMLRAGVWLNAIGIVLISLWMYAFGPMAFGISLP